MSMSRKIAAAVDEQIRACAAPSAVAVEDGPHRLCLAITLATPVGISCDALEFSTTAPPPGAGADQAGRWPVEALRAWGDRLATRLTYLMEPLVLHEVDSHANTALYRSTDPTVREGRRSYYEASFKQHGGLRLARFTFDQAARRREPAPCQFTREVLERLAEDLVESVEGR